MAESKYTAQIPKWPAGLLQVPDFLEPKPTQLLPDGYGQAAVLFHPDNLTAHRTAVD